MEATLFIYCKQGYVGVLSKVSINICALNKHTQSLCCTYCVLYKDMVSAYFKSDRKVFQRVRLKKKKQNISAKLVNKVADFTKSFSSFILLKIDEQNSHHYSFRIPHLLNIYCTFC